MGLAAGPPGRAPGEGGSQCGAVSVGQDGAGARPSPRCPALLPGKRTKKGMATAKQRLGKILKIHRNGKLLL